MINRFIKLLALCATFVLGHALASPKIIHLQKGDKQVALFGTVHIAKPDFYPLPQPVLNTLKQADALAVEMDITDADLKKQTMQLMLATAFTQDTQPLTEKQLSQIKAIFGNVDNSLGGEPWFLSVIISLERADQQGFSETGIDEYLIALAKKQRKPVISLEAPNEQIGIFSQIPRSESLQLFDDAVSDDFPTELAMTESIWRNNDKLTAEQLHQKMQAETPVLYRLINIERNQTIAQRIVTQTQKHPQLFVAIGAMHLYGKGSVIENLLNHGFEVVE